MIQLTTATAIEKAITKARTVKSRQLFRLLHRHQQDDGRDLQRDVRKERRQTLRFMYVPRG